VTFTHLLLLTLATSLTLAQSSGALRPDPPRSCGDCAGWNKPHEPFRVFGNTYYVGVDGLSALLVTGAQGSILLDGGLPQSAALIDANIRKLGFRTEDVKLIVNSHAHYDHAGGIAAIQRLSGAAVAASAAGAKALERGEPTPDDPQFAFGRAANAFPAITGVRAVGDGETLRVGDLAITARLTPGHTPGATTWTWRSCDGGRPSTGSGRAAVVEARCYNMVYADSLNAVSASDFRFTGAATHPSLIDTFRATIAKVRALPCDIIIGVHPGFTDLAGKLKRRQEKEARDPFVTPDGCRAYADAASKRLDERIAEEAKTKSVPRQSR
jgi:metallo-beta-lactamase class B